MNTQFSEFLNCGSRFPASRPPLSLWSLHRCVFNFHLQNRPNPHFLIKPLGFAVVARNWPTQGFTWFRPQNRLFRSNHTFILLLFSTFVSISLIASILQVRLPIQPWKTRDNPAFLPKNNKILWNLWNHRCVFDFNLQNRANPHFLIKVLAFGVVARNLPTQGFVLELIRRTYTLCFPKGKMIIKRYFSSYTHTHPYAPIRTHTHPLLRSNARTQLTHAGLRFF